MMAHLNRGNLFVNVFYIYLNLGPTISVRDGYCHYLFAAQKGLSYNNKRYQIEKNINKTPVLNIINIKFKIITNFNTSTNF